MTEPSDWRVVLHDGHALEKEGLVTEIDTAEPDEEKEEETENDDSNVAKPVEPVREVAPPQVADSAEDPDIVVVAQSAEPEDAAAPAEAIVEDEVEQRADESDDAFFEPELSPERELEQAEVLGASKKTEKKKEKKKKKNKRTWVHPGRHPDELSDKARVVLLVPFCGENSDTKMKNLIYCKMPANSTYGSERKFKNRVLYMQNSTA